MISFHPKGIYPMDSLIRTSEIVVAILEEIYGISAVRLDLDVMILEKHMEVSGSQSMVESHYKILCGIVRFHQKDDPKNLFGIMRR